MASEGRTIPSWIWLVAKPSGSNHPDTNSSSPSDPDTEASNSEVSDLQGRAASGEEIAVSIRAHWARCQARAERYEEEAALTVEEMRQVLKFFKWKSQWWLELQDARVNSTAPPDPQVQHGLRAYAHRQSSIYSSLARTYIDHWRGFLTEHSLGLDWISEYPLSPSPATKSTPAEEVDPPLESNDDVSEMDVVDPTDPDFEERFSDLLGN